MSPSPERRVEEFYAETYDQSLPDWPGEMDFYRGYAAEVRARGERLLDVACGTGRIAIRLAQEGTHITGLDRSKEMLHVAREKSRGIENLAWVESDMRSFELGKQFGLAIIAGHAFQNLNTPDEQAACLRCIHTHLKPGGRLIVHLDHQDLEWLGDLMGEKRGVFDPEEQFVHAQTGRHIQAFRAWTYEPSTQSALCTKKWEARGDDGEIVDRWETEPVRLHCVFRFEMEHVLRRAGFEVEAVYGDFFRNPLEDKSPAMIWVAARP